MAEPFATDASFGIDQNPAVTLAAQFVRLIRLGELAMPACLAGVVFVQALLAAILRPHPACDLLPKQFVFFLRFHVSPPFHNPSFLTDRIDSRDLGFSTSGDMLCLM